MPERITRLSCCRFNAHFSSHVAYKEANEQEKNGAFLDIFLLLISLGSYEGKKCPVKESALTQAALTSVAAVNGGRAERQEPVGLEHSSVALVRNSKGEHLYEPFIRYDKPRSAIKQFARV